MNDKRCIFIPEVNGSSPNTTALHGRKWIGFKRLNPPAVVGMRVDQHLHISFLDPGNRASDLIQVSRPPGPLRGMVIISIFDAEGASGQFSLHLNDMNAVRQTTALMPIIR